MRIRKNARLGGSLPTEKLQPLVCQLNQSPWDVIPFGSDLIQFEYGEDDSFAGNANGSAGNSGGAVESVASPMDAELKSPPNIQHVVVHDNDDFSEQNGIAQPDYKAGGENKTTSCGQCKNNEAKKQGQSNHEHNNLSSARSKKAAALAGARRTRAQSAKKAPSATSNPYEFYYYSGFGPLWGKRRGGRNGGLNNKNEVKAKGGEDSTITEANGATIQSPCSSSQIDTEGFDYADDEVEEDYDDEAEEGNGESGKKRVRKPVKARSLKSLM
ncbi:uncharacterized protein LOC114727798 isoform X2 [Neltuma alba]|uniref:uncharacterized protein LOC114727798 isoform X2 n=1 Tax=Neltuma alba TaxID=207710 RepID=UPI0010A58DEC|nr:uncharacterized protein LOC114727798 isoform X2 [Prosopis alba]